MDEGLDYEEIITTIRDAVRDVPKEYRLNCEAISDLEKERIDLLHYAELVDLNAVEGFHLYKDIQRVEQERRKIKDENDQLRHINNIVSKWRDWLGPLDYAVGNVRKAKQHLEDRSYRCRVRKDLEGRINGVEKKN